MLVRFGYPVGFGTELKVNWSWSTKYFSWSMSLRRARKAAFRSESSQHFAFIVSLMSNLLTGQKVPKYTSNNIITLSWICRSAWAKFPKFSRWLSFPCHLTKRLGIIFYVGELVCSLTFLGMKIKTCTELFQPGYWYYYRRQLFLTVWGIPKEINLKFIR